VTGTTENAAGAWVAISDLPYGPESGASTLSLTLGAVRSVSFVNSTQNSSGAETTLVGCPDRVELVADATVATSGGALDEQFEAVLTASMSGDVTLTQLFDPTKLAGAFAFDPQALGAKRFTRLTFSNHWLTGSFSSRLSAGLEESSGTGPDASVSFSDLPLACFSTAENGTPSDCTQ
jgi:hypothetical protein